MPVRKDASRDIKREKKEPVARPSPGDVDAESHVPEWAENMEHTLKRLVGERQRERDKNPGLYL